MSSSHIFDSLPKEILTLSGYEFFQFIKNTLGEPEAHLLNKISVKSTSSFLLTEDPLDIFNYDVEDEELENLKNQLCFKLKNQKLLIKPGIISGFKALKDALKRRASETLAQPKKQKRSFIFNSSSITSLPNTVEKRTVPNTLSLSEHKQYAVQFIKRWCAENKKHFGLEDFDLEENIDFILNIELDKNSDVMATIKCKCNKIISLGNNENKIQLSNYYKHLQSVTCDHMRHLKNVQRQIQSTQEQEQQPSLTTTLTSVSQPQLLPMQVNAACSTPVQEIFHDNTPILSNQIKSNGKRRWTPHSKMNHPSKRSRT